MRQSQEVIDAAIFALVVKKHGLEGNGGIVRFTFTISWSKYVSLYPELALLEDEIGFLPFRYLECAVLGASEWKLFPN